MRWSPLLFLCLALLLPIQAQRVAPASETVYLLKPARVFDGESSQLHENWAILVRGRKIEAAGPISTIKAPAGAKVIELAGLTMMPGLIEAHSHVLLHPYSETVWNDQVARESLSLRVARSEEHTSELQSQSNLVCRLLLEKKKNKELQLCNHNTE